MIALRRLRATAVALLATGLLAACSNETLGPDGGDGNPAGTYRLVSVNGRAVTEVVFPPFEVLTGARLTLYNYNGVQARAEINVSTNYNGAPLTYAGLGLWDAESGRVSVSIADPRIQVSRLLPTAIGTYTTTPEPAVITWSSAQGFLRWERLDPSETAAESSPS